MEESRYAFPLVERDTTKMLCVDRRRDVLWHDRASTACAHDRDENVTRTDGVALKFRILGFRNESALAPAKLVLNNVVNAKNRNPFIDKLAVQQLATEWACSDRARA